MFEQLREREEFQELTNAELHELISAHKILGDIVEVVDLVVMDRDDLKGGDSFSKVYDHMEHQFTYCFKCTKRTIFATLIY